MPRHLWSLAILLFAMMAVVVFSLPRTPWPVRIWVALLLIGLPAAMVAQARALEDPAGLPRTAVYASSIVSLWLLALVSAIVAWLGGFGADALGVKSMAVLPFIAWSGGLLVLGLGLSAAATFAGLRESPVLRHLLPVTSRERMLFAALSITAGVCEEFVFRGFLLHAVAAGTGSQGLGVALSAGAFGIVHAYQRPAGAIRAASLGALLAVPVVVTGSLMPSAVSHAALDLVAGLWLRERLLR